MERYKNLSGSSGVTHYAIGENFIEVRFEGKSTIYIYDYSLNGKTHIEKMKSLALTGKGLGSYISQHPDVKNNYRKK
jgi:hypothetical protein